MSLLQQRHSIGSVLDPPPFRADAAGTRLPRLERGPPTVDHGRAGGAYGLATRPGAERHRTEPSCRPSGHALPRLSSLGAASPYASHRRPISTRALLVLSFETKHTHACTWWGG